MMGTYPNACLLHAAHRTRCAPKVGAGQVTSKAIALSKVMTIPELEELERKMLAQMEKEKAAGKVIEAPK